MTEPSPPLQTGTYSAGLRWRTSSYSGNTGGQCVQVAIDTANRGLPFRVRDSKDTAGPKLAFSALAWRSFTASVKAGDIVPG
jgi:hypothetical protein